MVSPHQDNGVGRKTAGTCTADCQAADTPTPQIALGNIARRTLCTIFMGVSQLIALADQDCDNSVYGEHFKDHVNKYMIFFFFVLNLIIQDIASDKAQLM